MFIDTHCHLNMIVEKKRDVLLTENNFLFLDPVIKEANQVGVKKIINIGTSLVESINSTVLAQRYDGVFAAIGIHPCDCTDDWKRDFEDIKKLLKNREQNRIVAIGETGLDFFHRPFHKSRQFDAFRSHLELAIQNDLPLVVHVREAADEILKVLQEYKNEMRGVIHCFSQDKCFADTVLSWGLYLGINGPITYPKNQEFRELVAQLPFERILLETDAPFLPPQAYRGKQNRPAYVPIIAQTIADLHGVELNVVEDATTKNAQGLFGI
jgi:TatD DNase family protein